MKGDEGQGDEDKGVVGTFVIRRLLEHDIEFGNSAWYTMGECYLNSGFSQP
jgi:hypothetical protein